MDSIRIPRSLCMSWTPLFVVINPKSGGALGFQLLRKFRQILHPVQVVLVIFCITKNWLSNKETAYVPLLR